ncbi:RNA polymerase sigma factor [Novosphingobium sp.]|uniref:RNA polymerase sigma factor n=1 Tax=Novosphingobium sp. TaxID=1874826 RepID=UPI002B461B3C|nr:sigma-70 family RNA polymerase sigma factor [Novosphingobium sp.]HKR92938.1 sigma-70 family RNA polymerase sigma factor [Novosphingobium sp.]
MSYNTPPVIEEDDQSSDKLVRRWRPALKAFFLRRLQNRSEAEDLTQEVLIRVLEQGTGRGDSYVFQIAQNLLIDRQRRSAVRDRYRAATIAEQDRHRDPLDAHRILQEQEQLTIAMAALAALPERTRAIFILYRFEKISQGDIAMAYGISASAVKQQVAKAMATIARALKEEQ